MSSIDYEDKGYVIETYESSHTNFEFCIQREDGTWIKIVCFKSIFLSASEHEINEMLPPM